MQKVYLSKSQTGTIGLFTYRFLVMPLSSSTLWLEYPQTKAGLRDYCKHLGFTLEDGPDDTELLNQMFLSRKDN